MIACVARNCDNLQVRAVNCLIENVKTLLLFTTALRKLTFVMMDTRPRFICRRYAKTTKIFALLRSLLHIRSSAEIAKINVFIKKYKCRSFRVLDLRFKLPALSILLENSFWTPKTKKSRRFTKKKKCKKFQFEVTFLAFNDQRHSMTTCPNWGCALTSH